MSELKVKYLTNLAEVKGFGIPEADLDAGVLKTYETHIPLNVLNPTTGTWARTVASHVQTYNKAQAAETSTTYIPILPRIATSANAGVGGNAVKLTKIYIPYTIGTANLTSAPTFTLYKITEVAAGVDTAASVTGTLTFAGTNTVGKDVGSYIATFTITTPEFVQADVRYSGEFVTVAAATSDVILKHPSFEHLGY